MGRSKPAHPIRFGGERREPPGSTQLLGRIILEGEKQGDIENLFAARWYLDEHHAEEEDEEEINLAAARYSAQHDDEPENRAKKIERRKSRRLQKKLNGAILDDDETDGEEEEEEEETFATPKIPKRKSNKRRIRFQDDGENPKQDGKCLISSRSKKQSKKKQRPPPTRAEATEATLLRRCELEVQTQQQSSNAEITHHHIHYSGPSENRKSIDSCSFLVRVIPLSCVDHIVSVQTVSMEEEGEDSKLPHELLLCSGKSMIALRQLPAIQDLQKHSSSSSWVHLSCCVENDLMVASLNSIHGAWLLRIFLSPKAMDLCHVQALPLTRVAHAPRYRSARWIHNALLEIFSGADSVPQIQQQHNNEQNFITAKNVYDWTDNAHIKQWLQQQKNEKLPVLGIPGLIPKLRPYQAAAVQWMIERETRPTPLEEWKLAWVVLPSGISLDQWEEKTNSDGDEGSSKVLFFCPLIGWLAKSTEEARAMSLDDDNNDNDKHVRGGILAESMGLGKTVEVLACILANPRPVVEYFHSPAALKPSDGKSHRRIVLLSEPRRSPTPSNTFSEGKPHMANVDDIREFGDADENPSSDEDMVKHRALPSSIFAKDKSNGDKQQYEPVPVTPEPSQATKYSEETEPREERWLDDDETLLGSCLCGSTVDIEEANKKQIVLCCRCKEPMHLECAGFDGVADMKISTNPVTFRKMFSDCLWICYETKDPSHCPCCVAETSSGQSIESRGTLIVTPPAILEQWELEIQRHTRSLISGEPLKVGVYKGVEKTTKSRQNMKSIHPFLLGDHDIVLMTFDALMSDFGHSVGENKFVGAEGGDSSLRKRKRYRVVPSPLSVIRWWRVCLDEAQRVERPTATSARMALKLKAHNRWCVTGTPVGRGKLEDLFGLLLFLRVNPFMHRLFFNKALDSSHPNIAVRIQNLLKNVFWRSTKANDQVRQQMGVPEQLENKNFLRFSSIEKHFYQQQLEATLGAAGELAERRRKGKHDKTKHLNLLADHLHRLRAACCHPQVGSGGITNKQTKKASESRVGSRVMSMEEILVRLIDDARLKCEESQRLAVLHSNGMAALSRLQVEARGRGEEHAALSQRSDDELLVQSCKLYLESLELVESNSKPTPVLARGHLSGSTGFRALRGVLNCGKGIIDWKVETSTKLHQQPLWSRIDFDGNGRRIARLKLRPITKTPQYLLEEVSPDFQWEVLVPKSCVFEVSSAAAGGEFVPVTRFSFPIASDEWVVQDGFRTNTKSSKSWRVVVETCHKNFEAKSPSAYYVGLEVELHEEAIATDPLQRLHALHNASLSFSSLLQLRNAEKENKEWSFLSEADMYKKMQEMTAEAKQIESLYMQVAQSSHRACLQHLIQASEAREDTDNKLRQLVPAPGSTKDCWDSEWWDEFLVACHLYGEERQVNTIGARVQEELENVERFQRIRVDRDKKERKQDLRIKFPPFRDVNGLQAALKSRIQTIRTDGLGEQTTWMKANTAPETEEGEGIPETMQFRTTRFKCPRGMHEKCVKDLCSLSSAPTNQEMYENSHCQVCKADWNQRGPKCRHCVLGDLLLDLDPDPVTLAVMKTLNTILRGPIGTHVIRRVEEITGESPNWVERAKLFFDVLEAQKREKVFAWRYWRTHLDLLNDLDELNQSKASMRLSYEGENLMALTGDQLNAIVAPCDLMPSYHENAAKQAMALGDLRRSKETLRYLINQSDDCDKRTDNTNEETCAVCLNPFESDRAVLSCGHSFHASPCLERLKSRSSIIACPMRCRVRTKAEDVLIASDKRRDDGSHNNRAVKGSWGTKVTRVVADLLDIKDLGEKAVLFSQWEDMLDIVAEALSANDISFVRPVSLAKIGDALKIFRSQECTVLMLNVKNGAEGLTILEATHVLMLEPLLNNALDSQAINRVSRIGQKRKTTVHRYVVEQTVEIKIDNLRMEHQDDAIEDTKAAKHSIRAGGLDGGFSSEGDLMKMLSLDDSAK